MNQTAIQVHGLRKTYGASVAVADVDLVVHTGEVFALLGPNGAGKTTTIEILVGVRQRTAGNVHVLGNDPGKDHSAWRARIGVVPQTTGEYLDLTVREVVSHFGSFYPHPFNTDELLDRVGLLAKSRSSCTSLSGGQKRRLDVAVGVVGRPELIFLDEPTTGLDPEARREAWGLVRYFRELGVTTVLTTHYLDEAEALADRAGIIAAGRMQRVGTVAELTRAAGRSHQVSFQPIDGRAPHVSESLAVRLPGNDSHITLSTDRPTELLSHIIEWARLEGRTEVPDLKVTRPTLEDTYLALLHSETTGTAR